MSATELAVEATMDSVGTPSDVWVSLSTETIFYQKCFVLRHIKLEPHSHFYQRLPAWCHAETCYSWSDSAE